jgi:hypothetical protein
VGADRSNCPRRDYPSTRKTGGDDDCRCALGDRYLRHASPPQPPPQPDTAQRDTERLAEPLPAAVQEHRHRVHRRPHLLRRLAVREAEHVSVQHGCALLCRQAGERRANLGHPSRLLNRIVLERFRVQAPAAKAARCVKRDGGEPSARIARDRAALDCALRIEERCLHDVLGIVTVVELALHQPDESGSVLPIQALDLGGHAEYVPAHQWERNEVCTTTGCAYAGC